MTKTLGYMPKKSKINATARPGKSKSTVKKKTTLSGEKQVSHSNLNNYAKDWMKNASIEGINSLNPANY